LSRISPGRDEEIAPSGERLAGLGVDGDRERLIERDRRGSRHAERGDGGLQDVGRRIVVGEPIEEERRFLGVADVAQEVVLARRGRGGAAELVRRARGGASPAVLRIAGGVDAVIRAANEASRARDAAVAAARPAGARVANATVGALVVFDAGGAIAVRIADAAGAM
jgi:hypothetical protein